MYSCFDSTLTAPATRLNIQKVIQNHQQMADDVIHAVAASLGSKYKPPSPHSRYSNFNLGMHWIAATRVHEISGGSHER